MKIEVSLLIVKFSTFRETYILWSLIEGRPEFLDIRKLFREIFIELDGINEKSLKYDEECEECHHISGRDHTVVTERNGEYEETDLRDRDETSNEVEYREKSPIDVTIYISYRRDNALNIFDFLLGFFRLDNLISGHDDTYERTHKFTFDTTPFPAMLMDTGINICDEYKEDYESEYECHAIWYTLREKKIDYIRPDDHELRSFFYDSGHAIDPHFLPRSDDRDHPSCADLLDIGTIECHESLHIGAEYPSIVQMIEYGPVICPQKP